MPPVHLHICTMLELVPKMKKKGFLVIVLWLYWLQWIVPYLVGIHGMVGSTHTTHFNRSTHIHTRSFTSRAAGEMHRAWSMITLIPSISLFEGTLTLTNNMGNRKHYKTDECLVKFVLPMYVAAKAVEKLKLFLRIKISTWPMLSL